MSVSSKSPRKILCVALATAQKSLPLYAHRFSPKKFTQHQLFACLVLKTFFKVDYRGIVAILRDAPEICSAMGLLHVPHFTTLHKASRRLLRAPRVERLLDRTVRLAMGRRRQVALGAVDSTGMESRHISSYYVKRRSRDPGKWQTTTYTRFPKLGLVCDCRTHVVLSLLATRGPTPDINQFRRTLHPATRRVRIRHVVADAGYDSESNHRYAREACGIRTTIPPKHGRPTTKLPKGRYRRLMKQRFDTESYGQRWQSETVFSMIKRNLGSALRSRTYWAQCRELGLIVLTHNIMIILSRIGFLQSMSGIILSALENLPDTFIPPGDGCI